MKRKPIRIDWDELESAFDSKLEGDLYYLVLVTGEVVLEGEGEGHDSPDDDDMEEALETGATDRSDAFRLYVQPPVPEEETEWMRRFLSAMDLLSREVRRGGESIELQPREFALLEYMMRHANRPVTKTMILEHIFDYSFDPQTNVVDVLVHRLRAKVEQRQSHDPHDPRRW